MPSRTLEFRDGASPEIVLPRTCDVAIVGAGITGCATAYQLAKRDVDVLVLDQADVNAAASGRNAGSLHGQIQRQSFDELGEAWAHAFLPALSFLAESLAMWKGLSDELGVDLEVTTNGGLLIAETADQMRAIERKVAIERTLGLPFEVLSRSDLTAIAPYVSSTMIGAELSPIEGKANPLLVASAFARVATSLGATIVPRTTVRHVELSGGRFQVETDRGVTFASQVVIAAGAAITGFSRQFGSSIPITEEPVQVSATEPVVSFIPHLLYFAGDMLTLKQAYAGSVLIGGGWPARHDACTGRIAVSLASLRANLGVAAHVVPAIGDALLIRSWAGMGHGTPDQRPIIGELPGCPGLSVGMFPYMGFTAGPLMGLVLAELVQGICDRDLSSFRPDRFT